MHRMRWKRVGEIGGKEYSGSKSVPMLSHFEEIRELWNIKKKSGKVPVG